MAFDALLARQQTSSDPCIACPTQPPSCPCNLNTDQCVLIENHFICQPLDSGSSGGSSGGVSSGAVAGAVVAVILALGIAVAGFIFYRRRQRQKRLAEEADAKPDSPARAEDVLNRPDPNEKPPSPPPPHSASYASTSGEAEAQTAATSAQATQGHASNPRASVQSNPFGDSHSIQTTDTGNQSNVIPIALVAPSPRIAAASGASSGYGPMRPVRTPDIHLEPLGQPSSAAPGANPNRASYMTTGSYASDLLGEAPVIITPTRGAVKQVLGVVKAEVIRAPSGPSASGVAEGLRPPPIRAPMRSPLAASSFGPSDVVQEVTVADSERNDPFGDEHASDAGSHSPAPSHSTFGSPGRSPRPVDSEPLGNPCRGSQEILDWFDEWPTRWVLQNSQRRPRTTRDGQHQPKQHRNSC
ncbi:hypothetical protein CERSUDRAFT_91098 [Gelatoporia subvermispora B]|uniref:Membrane anchor Opy2 N-terminal domain-containing protein n=1 Tax=Ceriporiopsis subvermispora (strain B) TaxID=914234 RepID=M2QTK1_CERS8|nr:hypothetical protein CERSUDRAFT_91098 [Gelatoporia subvermispora B]